MKYLRRTILVVTLSAASSVQSQTEAPSKGTADQGNARPIAESVCAACHGADGNSPIAVNPSLAGQHSSYLYKQLTDFKSEYLRFRLLV